MKQIGGKVSALITTFVIIAIVTTLILPNRPTPDVIRLFFTATGNAVRAASGLPIPNQTKG
jgi:hypothetical protein